MTPPHLLNMWSKSEDEVGGLRPAICVQVILCQINIFCHQLTQNMTTDFVRFTKTYTNCSKIQNTSLASFEFQNNLRKSS